MTHCSSHRLCPFPELQPCVDDGLTERRRETAIHLVNAAQAHMDLPEVRAKFVRFFPNATSVGRHARERR